jgi:hypothetical protein
MIALVIYLEGTKVIGKSVDFAGILPGATPL